MMQIVARLKFGKPENREVLIMMFYGEEYSSNNVLTITNDTEAEVVINFDEKPPKQIVTAMSQCQVMSWYNVQTNDAEVEPKADQNVNATEEPGAEPKADQNVNAAEEPGAEPEAAQKVNAAEDPEENLKTKVVENPKVKTKTRQSKKKGTKIKVDSKKKKSDGGKAKPKRRYGFTKPSPDFYLTIKELDLFAVKVGSFGSFVDVACRWLGLDEQYVDCLVNIFSDLSKLDQEGYELWNQQMLDVAKSLGFNAYFMSKCGKAVKEGLAEKGIQSYALAFYCTLLKYKNDWKNNVTPDTETEPEVVAEVESKQEATPEVVECTFMNREAFAAKVRSIDSNLSVEEKIKALLIRMGFEKHGSDLLKIACNMVATALVLEEFSSVEELMRNVNPESCTPETRLKISEMIYDFLDEHHLQSMNTVSFLKEFRKLSIFKGTSES